MDKTLLNQRLSFRRQQRREPSRIERVLWECLRDRRFMNLKFKRQVSVGPYVVDFWCEAHQLVVEADGPMHDDPARKVADERRDLWMRERGLRVVRLRQDEVLMATGKALQQVAETIGAKSAQVGGSPSSVMLRMTPSPKGEG
jgi:very-short-patch-repair endonuclease